MDAVISGVQNFQVAGLVPAFRQPGDYFGILGAPWGTMGAAEGHVQMAVISEADVIAFCSQDCQWSGMVPLLWLAGDRYGSWRPHFRAAGEYFSTIKFRRCFGDFEFLCFCFMVFKLFPNG